MVKMGGGGVCGESREWCNESGVMRGWGVCGEREVCNMFF